MGGILWGVEFPLPGEQHRLVSRIKKRLPSFWNSLGTFSQIVKHKSTSTHTKRAFFKATRYVCVHWESKRELVICKNMRTEEMLYMHSQLLVSTGHLKYCNLINHLVWLKNWLTGHTVSLIFSWIERRNEYFPPNAAAQVFCAFSLFVLLFLI